jgi:hypothetical protein
MACWLVIDEPEFRLVMRKGSTRVGEPVFGWFMNISSSGFP